MKRCAFKDFVCVECGVRTDREDAIRQCPFVSSKETFNNLPRVAVGDLVETMLTSVGITKELVQRLTRTKDCGCKARQRWLNQWGYRQQDRIERLLNKAARWYGVS